jgi:hypothetical protein
VLSERSDLLAFGSVAVSDVAERTVATVSSGSILLKNSPLTRRLLLLLCLLFGRSLLGRNLGLVLLNNRDHLRLDAIPNC